MKKLALTVVGGGLVVVVSLAGMMFKSFSGLSAIPEVSLLGSGVVGVADGFVQAFLIPDGQGGAVLIDCGADEEAKVIKAKLAERKLRVTAMFVTHGHGDHVAGCREFPDAPMYLLEAERGLVEGTAKARGPLTQFGKNDKAKMHQVSAGLKDGESVDVKGVVVQAFAIPGHTEGSAAYLVNDVLFLGDSVAAESSGKLRSAPWIFSDDVERAALSVKALAKRLEPSKVKHLAFSHSGPMAGIDALIAYSQAP